MSSREAQLKTAGLAAASILLAVLTGCASSPTAGMRYWSVDQCVDSPSVVVNLKLPDGERFASVPRQSCVALRSAALKIEAAAGYQLSGLYVSDNEAPNAFATRDKSGRPIAVVTLGMLTALGADEGAWAGLLGHEIAHHVRRHGEGRRGAQTASSVTGNVVANVISYTVPGVGGLIGGVVAGSAAQNAVYGSYTRPQEAEADELGLKWMVAAGYDPQGLLRLFATLGKQPSLPVFLSTHPAAEDRYRMVEAFIASPAYSTAKPAPSQADP